MMEREDGGGGRGGWGRGEGRMGAYRGFGLVIEWCCRERKEGRREG